MDLKLFSEGLFDSVIAGHHERKAQAVQHEQDQADIKAFHEHHAKMEEIAKRLDKSGHRITIDYNSPHVVRHGRKSGTHFVNAGLNTEKKIQISKREPLRPFD